jgi:glycosyltransferase involved in cell wall biosynthesis
MVNKILAVDFLPRKFKQGMKYYAKNLLFGQKNKSMIYGDLTSACYRVSDKSYVYSAVDSLWSERKIIKELKNIVKRLNMQSNLIVWSYNPMFLGFLNKMNYDLFVFDTVDNWTEHEQYLKLIKRNKLMNNYKKISAKADVIFTVSFELLDFYKKFGGKNNIFHIANGVDFDHYANPENYLKQTELDQIDKKTIGYIGTIQERFDFDLVGYIAKKNKNKVIALAGPVWKSVEKQAKEKLNLPNVKFLGRVEFEKAPAYINKFDVCIIPHKIDQFIKFTNPMKMYEYLAVGKPIVSTKGAGVSQYADYVHIANDYEKFNQYIQKALGENTAELAQKRKKAAQKQDWSDKIDQMLKIIEEKL